MTETPCGTPRLWAEFADPAEPAQRIRADLTWLTSSWTCLFGRGTCPGILADAPDAGCCTLGAHFTDDEDRERVAAVVDRLGPEDWEQYEQGRTQGWLTDDDATRTVDGACIFLNRPGFPAGPGCALHTRAVADGLAPHTVKPDVCWQLPLRRDYREVTLPDGEEILEITIGEYDRRCWGPGGHDLDWYCSGAPAAHTGDRPVFRSLRAELVELIGPAAYAELERACTDHLAATRALTASPEGRRLLELHVHPATRAATDGLS